MTDQDRSRSPGEENTRRRVRKQFHYYAVALVVGGLIGGMLAFGEEGQGNFFSRDFAGLALDPNFALLIAAALFFGFVVLPLWGLTRIDELLREQNFVGMTGGCMAVIGGYPVWVVLYAGGFTEMPHAYGIFLLAFFGMTLSFLYAKLRSHF